MKKNKVWIIIFLIIAVLSLLYILLVPKATSTAVIRIGNEVIREIDLLSVREPYEFLVECEEGNNTIRVEQGKICIIDADCDDKLCVNMGYIKDSTVPIVCLPHKLSVSIEGRR